MISVSVAKVTVSHLALAGFMRPYGRPVRAKTKSHQ
jgi:hypothetical protein